MRSMLKKNFVTVFFVLSIFGLGLEAVQARGHPIYTPGPIPIQGLSKSKVEKAALKVLRLRKWKPQIIKPGVVRGVYTKFRSGRSGGITYKAVVDLDYSGNYLNIRYVHSEELLYDKEAGTIHSAYNRWVRTIERDIRVELDVYL